MLKSQDCKGIKLLYVEDDKMASDAMVKIFSKFFDNITVAYDGQEGFEYVANGDFDLIVTDINMPKLSGMEMVKKIKKDLNKNIYTIMLTAYSDNHTFLESVELGVKGYVIKPLCITQFVETLKTAVGSINAIKKDEIVEHYNNIIVSKTDLEGKITFVNDKFCKISGYTADELIGKNHNIMKDPEASIDTFKNLWETITNRNIWVGQIKNIKKDGTSYRVDSTICPIVDDSGKIVEYIALRNDVSNIYDPIVVVQDLISYSQKPLLIMLKIENYYTLQKIYSANLITEMLKIFDKMLFTYLPIDLKMDSIINFDNGEFALFKDMQTNHIDIDKLEDFINQFQQNIEQGIIIVDEYDFDLSVIISFSTQKEQMLDNTQYGLSIVTQQNKTILCADHLIENVKDEAIKNTKTIKMIQTAINSNKVVSYFQAITNNKTMKVEKYESLIRIIDEDDNVISPYFFLEVAKESGYYSKLTNIVLENSFRALLKLDTEVSINLSAIDIENSIIRNHIISLLKRHKKDAHRVVFELLEDEQVRDFNVVKDFITLVKTYGVKIAIDDFGAGVSNFERLLDYQPDVLKIDACLIKHIDQDKYSKDVVETIQLFAWKQDIKTVAEFVETPEILKTVTDIGINYTQGYLLGKPMLLKDILDNK